MDFSRLMSLASGHVEARIVQTAVELGVFDALQGAPQSAPALSQTLHLDAQAAELLLNALASLDLLDKHGENFALSEISKQYLVRSSPHYAGAMIQFDASLWSCWDKLPEALRTGLPVRPPDMYQATPTETVTFIDAMDSLVKARGDHEVLAQVFDWRNVESLLDVGSGPATYPIALCTKFPRLRATIFDLPATLELTAGYVHRAALEERIRLIAGDYRSDEIPGTYDVIFLSNIVHGEDYSKNQALIGKLARHLAVGGRIIVKDHILDDSRARPPVGAVFSLLMLLTTEGGRCYSFSEIKTWLEGAGLQQIRQIELPAPLTSALVIGTKGA
jgi:3-hydroxy-5-methyl-1-naphthoate 3-O-methyltransferase